MGEIRVKIPPSALDDESKRLLKKVESLERKVRRLEAERSKVKADKAKLERAISAIRSLLEDLAHEFTEPWEWC